MHSLIALEMVSVPRDEVDALVQGVRDQNYEPVVMESAPRKTPQDSEHT